MALGPRNALVYAAPRGPSHTGGGRSAQTLGLAICQMRVLLSVLLACLAPAAWAGEPINVSRPGFQCVGSPDGVQLPETLSALRRLGVLLSEEVVRTEEWEGYKAVEKRLRFKGLSLHVITFTNQPERYSLGSLELSSPAWSVAPIAVGQPSEPLLRRLGARRTTSSGVWRFNGESESLIIEAHRGNVRRVLYECYTG